MVGRLVEARTTGEKAFKERTTDYTVKANDIDEYHHVNHAAYQGIFANVRTQEGIGQGMHVAALSMRFSGQFVEGDMAQIKTEEYRGLGNTSIVEQEMRKPESMPVRQVTKLVPAHFASAVFPPIPYDPREEPQVMDRKSNIQVEGVTHLPHTVFAPMFETERIEHLKDQGMSIASLMERGIIIVVGSLDASFRKVHTDDKNLILTSNAYLESLRGEHYTMICKQSATTPDGFVVSEQIARFGFIDLSVMRINKLPADLVEKFTVKQT